LKFDVGCPRLLQLWRRALHVGFAVLCLRYIHAVGAENGSLVGPLGLLLVAAAGLGAWRPQAALLTFAVAMPLLNGLPILGVAGGSPSVVFAALWLGWTARRLAGLAAKASGEPAGPPALLRILLATDLLITALLLSLGAQFWRHHDDAQFWTVFYRHTAAGYADPYYFLHSAFIWLQGLFWFRALLLTWQGGPWNARVKNPDQPSEGPAIGDGETSSPQPEVAGWVRTVFLSAAGLTAFFTLIEYSFSISGTWFGVGVRSAFEDIFSFGGVVAAIFVFAVAVLTKKNWGNFLCQTLYVAGVLSLVIVSWSRGTWLAAIMFLFIVVWLRLPRWCTFAFLAVGALSITFINANAQRPSWQNHSYLERLTALVRIEKLADKSAGRFDLYQKAFGMIRERPLLGHGVGSFYLSSPCYAKAGDPKGQTPNFAHNALLQIAAEQGVLVAALFAGLIGWTLWRGVRAWQGTGGRQATLIPGDRPSQDRLTLLGTTLALGVYVQTNLTSNSLNIYASNQFFFWFLMAAVLGMTHGEAEKRKLRVAG